MLLERYDPASGQSGRASWHAALCPRHHQPRQRGLFQRDLAERAAHDGCAASGLRPRQQRGRPLGQDAHPSHLERHHDRARLFLEAQCRMGFLCHAAQRGAPLGGSLPRGARQRSRRALDARPRRDARPHLTPMLLGLLGILAGLEFPIWLSYRGWSVLLLAPAAELVAAAASGEPLLAHWTETFMGGAAKFLAQFFPLFLFGKLMDDSGSVEVTEKFGTARGILAVALAGAIVTYGGVSLFVAFFVLVPMAQSLFKAADIPTAGAFGLRLSVASTPLCATALP